MGKYTFQFDIRPGGILRPYVFRSNMPGTGLLNQAILGKVMSSAFRAEGPEDHDMNIRSRDWYGRPVFSDVHLKIGDDSFEFINAILVVDQAKNIVQTTIPGRNGTVIEYISMGSHDITLDGSIEGEPYDREAVENLVRILQQPDTMEVWSEFLQIFGIYNVVCKSYNFRQQQGKQNTQLFTLKLLEDSGIDLVMK